MSTSSSSSELSYDHCFRGDKKAKSTSTSGSRNTAISAYPKVKKQYLNNRDTVSSWIKRKTQSNADVKPNASSSLCPTFSTDAYSYPRGTFLDPTSKVSYNRSFSCTETSYCHFKTDPNLVRKMSCENAVSTQSVSLSQNMTGKMKYPEQIWNSVDEEYDILTSSLGRQQKPLVKEITPGLVARMAVSYSNLTQKNASASTSHIKKMSHRKGIPAPGYVAKISDSFDYLAKTGNSNAFTNFDKGRKLHHTSSGVVETIGEIQPSNCKRSASESQVSKRIADVNYRTESLNSSFLAESHVASNRKETKDQNTERFVSLLDKEYNKVFEGKKVSQHQLKSHSQSNFNQVGSGRREMRFFPTNDSSELSGLPKKIMDNNMPVRKDILKFSSESLRHVSNFRAWYEDSEKIHHFSNESRKIQSYELHSTKKSTIPTSSAAHMYYTHLDSSEGIENIGFSCVDQLSSDSFDSNISTSCKEETGQRSNQVAHNVVSASQSVPHNLTVPGDIIDVTSPKSASFKFFNSPKFMKKLTSPKLDKKNIFKSKKQAKEKKAEQKEVSQLQNDKKFFGSPRLVRAIFGSPKSQKKVTVSSAVQTDQISLSELTSSDTKKSFHDLNRNDSFVTALDIPDNSSYMESHEQETAISKSSSNSSLNSNISNSLSPFTSSLYYVEARIKPQITISLPLVTDKEAESKTSPPETPRTPLKPTMGVAMLSKKRLPSVSGESSVSISSSKSSHEGSIKEAVPLRSEVSMDINGMYVSMCIIDLIIFIL